MLLLVGSYELLSLLVLCVSVKRCEEHNAFSKSLVEALHCEDAVHSVNAEPLGSVTHSLSLSENQTCGLVVHGQEYELCAFGLSFGELDGKICVVAVSKSCLADDFESCCWSFLHESITDALREDVVILPDHCDFLGESFAGDVLCACSALVGINEAHLENVILAFGYGST